MARKRHASGFTLIEMLLVVAVIALLISLILPAYGKAKDAAYGDQCQANLRIIHQATMVYASDNVRRFPPARQGDKNDPNNPVGWVQSPWYNINAVREGCLYEYMGENERAYVCPTFLAVFKIRNPSHANKTPAFTYSLSEYTGKSWAGQPGITTTTGEKSPATFGLYTDENAWIARPWSNHEINNGAMGVGVYSDPGSVVDGIGSFHKTKANNYDDGSANVLFLDGHADYHHISESKTIMTPLRYRLP